MRPKVTGAERRNGPTRAPRRSASSAAAASMARTISVALAKNADPSSVSDSLRVVRWRSRVPRLRSSCTRRSLTTDLARASRRAAALIDPDSATATKAVIPSILIVRISEFQIQN